MLGCASGDPSLPLRRAAGSVALSQVQLQFERRAPTEQLLDADFVGMALKVRDAILAQTDAGSYRSLGEFAPFACRYE